MRRRYKLHIASSAKLAGSNSANLIYADHCYWRLGSLGPNANSKVAGGWVFGWLGGRLSGRKWAAAGGWVDG